MGKHLEAFNLLELDNKLLNRHSNCHKRRKYFNSILNKELLIELIEVEQFSINTICKNILFPKGIKISAGSLIVRAKKLGIKTPTLHDSANNKKVKNKRKQTCLKKYGAENCLSKNTKAYKKKNKTIRKKYGVKNVFQLENIKEKSKLSMLARYGVSSPIHLDSHNRNNGRRSKVHVKIENILNDMQINFISEAKSRFAKYNTFFKKEYSPQVDILIDEKKIVIEIYGDLWHANPKVYKKTDLIHKWNGKISAKEIWAFDKNRIKHIEGFGYRTIILWEKDINDNIEKIKELLKNELC